MADKAAEDWLSQITTELNTSTWMALAGDSGDPILTKRGTRPGSSFADITFGLMMRRVLDFRHSLRSPEVPSPFPVVPWDGCRAFSSPAASACDGIQQHAPSCSNRMVTIGDVVWADDLAACLTCSCATHVATIVSTEVGCLADGFAQHGLTLAYGKAKTAALCVVRGPHSRSVRKQLFGHCGPEASCTISVLRENQMPDLLPLVHSYRHLGVQHSADGGVKSEITQRIGFAWAAFREARRKIFRSKRISVEKKAIYLQGLVMAKLTVGAGTWPPLRDGEEKAFHGCVINMYRQLLCLPSDASKHLYAVSVCARVGLASPDTILHLERLRYAVRLVRHGPEQLWALIRQDQSYCELMRGSFEWLYHRIRATCGLPSPASDWDSWQRLLCTRPGLFKGWVKRAASLQHLDDCATAKHAEFHQLLMAHVEPEQARCGEPRLEDCSEACIPCRRAFPNLLSWASHAARVHGYRAPGTRLARGRVCRGCGRTYATQHRLKRHLDHSDSCITHWGAFQPGVAVPETSGHLQAPPLDTPGFFSEEACIGVDPSICQELLVELCALPDSCVPDLLDIASRHYAPLSVIRNTFAKWMEGLD